MIVLFVFSEQDITFEITEAEAGGILRIIDRVGKKLETYNSDQADNIRNQIDETAGLRHGGTSFYSSTLKEAKYQACYISLLVLIAAGSILGRLPASGNRVTASPTRESDIF